MTVDLGVNYVASAIPGINDGIAIHTSLAHLIIGDDGWSVDMFKKYFDISANMSIILLIAFSIFRAIEE